MRRAATLQEEATTYARDWGWSIIPLHLPGLDEKSGTTTEWKGKEPLVCALKETHGHIKPYTSRNPSTEQLETWFADFGEDLGGPGFNLAVITGYSSRSSDYALYVLDIDEPNPPDVLRACGTTTVRTGREGGGWHFWFLGANGLYRSTPTLALPDGTTCEFKGVGSYVVAPPSLHATGTRYEFTIPLTSVQPLPGFVLEALTPLAEKKPSRFRGSTAGRLCIEQMWETPVEKGSRHNVLYALSQHLWNARNSTSFVANAIRARNRALRVPLPDEDVRDIVDRGWEKNRPDNQFGPLGCARTHEIVPWIDCSGCRHRTRIQKSGFDAARSHGLGPNEQSLLMLAATGAYESDFSAAKACNMDPRTVKKARTVLQNEGLWPDTPNTSRYTRH